MAKDAARLLTITEGKKKAAAACQYGLVTAGIGGAWTSTTENGDGRSGG